MTRGVQLRNTLGIWLHFFMYVSFDKHACNENKMLP